MVERKINNYSYVSFFFLLTEMGLIAFNEALEREARIYLKNQHLHPYSKRLQ